MVYKKCVLFNLPLHAMYRFNIPVKLSFSGQTLFTLYDKIVAFLGGEAEVVF